MFLYLLSRVVLLNSEIKFVSNTSNIDLMVSSILLRDDEMLELVITTTVVTTILVTTTLVKIVSSF